mgnify:CR=1 FL=1
MAAIMRNLRGGGKFYAHVKSEADTTPEESYRYYEPRYMEEFCAEEEVFVTATDYWSGWVGLVGDIEDHTSPCGSGGHQNDVPPFDGLRVPVG